MDNMLTGPPLPITFWNEIDRTFGDYILDYIRRHEDRVIMINGETGQELRLFELAEKSLNLAAQLQALGCTTDTNVAVCSENGMDNLVAVLAIFLSGATSVTLNPSSTLDELHHVVSLTKPVTFFCTDATYQKTKEMETSHPCIRHIILSGHPPASDFKTKLFSDLVQKSDIKYREPPYDPDRTLMILLSSGTTGLPKGVMLSNRNALFQLHMTTHTNMFDFQGNVLSISNMHHVSGMFVPFWVLTYGKTLVVSTTPDNEDFFVSLIPKYKIKTVWRTTFFVVNFVKSGLAQKHDISSLEQIITGGSHLSLGIERAVTENLKIKRLQLLYGMTESFYVTAKRWDSKKTGTMGQVVPGITVKVVDRHTNKNLGCGQIGEICYKGPIVMKGYINNPDATADAIRDGWLHSGDLGYYDADGDLFYVDRIKELIKYYCTPVAPVELEEILMQHSAIKDAAVIGIPDEDAGELAKAFVVRRHGQAISEKEVLDFVASKVSSWKNLHGGVAFVDHIPRNSVGKILRRRIRELYTKNT